MNSSRSGAAAWYGAAVAGVSSSWLDIVSNKKAIIYTDGGADPNPGPGAIGVVIKNDRGETLHTISRGIGRTTNNQAEYRAVIAGLEKALSLGIE